MATMRNPLGKLYVALGGAEVCETAELGSCSGMPSRVVGLPRVQYLFRKKKEWLTPNQAT